MQYPLILATGPEQQRVLRLLDEHGVQVGAQQVYLPEYSPWTGLFATLLPDLRRLLIT